MFGQRNPNLFVLKHFSALVQDTHSLVDWSQGQVNIFQGYLMKMAIVKIECLWYDLLDTKLPF